MKTRAAALALAVGMAVLLGFYLGWRPSEDLSDGPARVVPEPASEAKGPASPSPERALTAPAREHLPESLVGTREDGALVLDGEGRFRPTPDAIDLFDYYLAATGEESDDKIRARIIAAIEARLVGRAALEARELLDQYLDYRERAGEMLSGGLVGEDIDRRLQYIRELRRDVFGREVAQALFGEAEARWFVDLERQRILADDDLDPADREQRLAALHAEQPPEVIAAHSAARAHRTLRAEEAQLREVGAGAEEISQFREEQFGEAGAQRLADLDVARAEWQQRLEVYRAARNERLVDVPAEDRQRLLEALRAEHFDTRERIRVDALDRAEARAGTH